MVGSEGQPDRADLTFRQSRLQWDQPPREGESGQVSKPSHLVFSLSLTIFVSSRRGAPQSIVDNLRQRSFDVTSARDVGRLRLDDASQLAFAADEGRAIVTHNRLDFERLHQRYFSEGREHHGIIIAKRRPSDTAVVVKLLTLLNEVTADDMINQLRYV